MKKLIFVLGLLAVTPSFAEWTYVTSNAEETFNVYLDFDTIEHKHEYSRAWVLYDLKKPDRLNEIEKSYLSFTLFEQYNCTAKMVGTLSSSYFPKNMRHGMPVFSNYKAYMYPSWTHVSPGSISEQIFILVCNGNDRNRDDGRK